MCLGIFYLKASVFLILDEASSYNLLLINLSAKCLLLIFASVLEIHDLCAESRCIPLSHDAIFFLLQKEDADILICLSWLSWWAFSMTFFFDDYGKEVIKLSSLQSKIKIKKKSKRELQLHLFITMIEFLGKRTVYACIRLAWRYILFPKK